MISFLILVFLIMVYTTPTTCKQIFKAIDFAKSTSMLNSISFISWSLSEFYQSTNTKNKRKKDVMFYSSVLLFIAGFHYCILDVNRPSYDQEILIRYSDWFFTTPLLLLVIGKFYSIQIKTIYSWILFDILMILNGFIYEKTNQVKYWAMGVLSYFILLGLLYKDLPEREYYWKYFVVGWSSYGVVSRFDKSKRTIYYNIADMYNKLVFAIDIRTNLE